MRVERSIEIASTPTNIWPYFIEPDRILQWCITFKKFEYTGDQRGGVGTPVYIEEQAGGPLMKMHFQITEHKENESLALRMVSGTGLKSYKQSWSLETIPSGSRMTFREEIELPFGIIGKLLASILARGSVASVDRMLVKLKTLAEG